MKEPKIMFEKFISPYGDDDEARDLPTMEVEGDDGETESVNLRDIMDAEKPVQFLSTPMGIIPLTEWSDPNKNFNFWTGFTNFAIFKKVEDIMAKTDGVEAYVTWSPYRF